MNAKCYDFHEEVLLLDVVIEDQFQNIDLMEFTVPEEGCKKSDWQVPYMEQFLYCDKDEKLCPTYEEPDDDTSPVRICFFIFKGEGTILQTPYGNVDLSDPLPLPDSLAEIIEFDEED